MYIYSLKVDFLLKFSLVKLIDIVKEFKCEIRKINIFFILYLIIDI